MEKCMLCLGHVAGMLDRDQRTAKTCNLNYSFKNSHLNNSAEEVFVNNSNHQRQQDSYTNQRVVLIKSLPHSSCKTRRNGYLRKSLQRLTHALILGAYLSLLAFPRRALSAPAHSSITTTMTTIEDHDGVNESQMKTFDLSLIVNQADLALTKLDSVKQSFVEASFGTDNLRLIKDRFKNYHNDWMLTIKVPKELGESLNPVHLKGLDEFDSTLTTVYMQLQRIAVGLAQIQKDHEGGQFEQPFKEAVGLLGGLRDEFISVIQARKLPVPADVDMSIMSESRKSNNASEKNVRNWLIYRDYMSMLEYVIAIFNHFNEEIDSLKANQS